MKINSIGASNNLAASAEVLTTGITRSPNPTFSMLDLNSLKVLTSPYSSLCSEEPV